MEILYIEFLEEKGYCGNNRIAELYLNEFELMGG
jgi:hypothetical protein